MKTLVKKAALFLMTVVSFIMLMAVGASATREKVYCYKYSLPVLEATYNYLNDFYLGEHPEFSLAFHYGSPSDQQVIKEKAIEITKNCKTDAEKAMTIATWIKNNINYCKDTPYQYPIDVYVNKEADCLGIAYLMSDMMRSVGISTVPIIGYVGDMVSTFDESFVLEKKVSGHAFVFACIDSQWLLYDPLFNRYAISDTDLISKWYFITAMEGVLPYFEEVNYDLHKDAVIMYKNGKFYQIGFVTVLNSQYHFIAHGFEVDQQSFFSVRTLKKPDNLEQGECYRDDWFFTVAGQYIGDPYNSNGRWENIVHAPFQKLANGMQLVNVINKRGDTYCYGGMDLTNEIDEYFLEFGKMVVYDGEYLPFKYNTELPLPEEFVHSDLTFEEKGFSVKYSISDISKNIATLDENNRLTVTEDGYVYVNIQTIAPDGGRTFDHTVTVYATKSDSCCECEYNRHVYKTLSRTEPDCTTDGTALKECVGCGKQKTAVLKKTGHKPEKVKGYSATCTEPGLTDGRRCASCGETVTKQEVIKPVGKHTFNNYEYFEPMCTKKGKITYFCSCGYSYTEAIEKKSHTYKTTTTKATLSKNGKIVKKCAVCGNTQTTTIYYPKSIKLSYTTTTYNGKVKKPTVTVKDSKGNTLKKDTDYTVKYASGRKNPGKYTVTVTFKGKYSGTKKLTLTIKPKAPSITSIYSKTKGKAVVKWANVTGESGFQLYYSTSKDGTYKKVKSYAVNKLAGSKTKLKSGKKYYFKVRAYKKTSSGTVYSSWSAVKSVKIK